MRGVLAGRVINIKIVAFIALHSVEYTDLRRDAIFYCTYFVRYATIYVDVSDSRSECGLRQGLLPNLFRCAAGGTNTSDA